MVKILKTQDENYVRTMRAAGMKVRPDFLSLPFIHSLAFRKSRKSRRSLCRPRICFLPGTRRTPREVLTTKKYPSFRRRVLCVDESQLPLGAAQRIILFLLKMRLRVRKIKGFYSMRYSSILSASKYASSSNVRVEDVDLSKSSQTGLKDLGWKTPVDERSSKPERRRSSHTGEINVGESAQGTEDVKVCLSCSSSLSQVLRANAMCRNTELDY